MSIAKVSLCVVALVCVAVAMPTPGGHGGHGGASSHIYRNDNGYNNFNFGYGISDPYTGDNHGRHEAQKGHGVYGSYYLSGPYGHGRKVDYQADYNGARQQVHGSQNGLYVHAPSFSITPGKY